MAIQITEHSSTESRRMACVGACDHPALRNRRGCALNEDMDQRAVSNSEVNVMVSTVSSGSGLQNGIATAEQLKQGIIQYAHFRS